MGKRILVLSGSPRKGGNCDLLAEEFIKEAERAGHRIDRFCAAGSGVSPCMACDRCWTRNGLPCVQEDGMQPLYPLLNQADAVVFATPLYFYGMSAQIRTVIDRFYPLCKDDKKPAFEGKQSAMILCGAEEDDDAFEGAVGSYERMIDYLNWEDCGILVATGLWEKGAAANAPEWLESARDLARNF